MAGLMGSPRNRAQYHVDDPWDDDGFWKGRKFKGHRRTGQPTGGRVWRRNIRSAERDQWRQDVREEVAQ